jgi:Domain of unknown function (DUF4382)
VIAHALLWLKNRPISSSLVALLVAVPVTVIGCGGGNNVIPSVNTGTVNVSLSDPPSCTPPTGPFKHVYVTVRSVEAHTSATAGDSSAGWQELAPQLASAPQQIDLVTPAHTNCVLAQLGSASLPVGSLQQLRLVLLSNTPAAGAATPSPNACAGYGFNCVVIDDGSIDEIMLSSEAQTGLKIPPGQIMGGAIQVAAGQSVDLNIDFNACFSIVQEGNGAFRLKPALTAGVVSANNSGIGGQLVDSASQKPIAGNVMVAIERTDSTGVDRVLMETTADSGGNFRFCPLPMGTFDIVAVALTSGNAPYNATAVVNVPNGSNLGVIPLVAEAGAAGPAILQGFVTATTATGGAIVDVSLAALQTISLSGNVTRQLNIPLQNTSATAMGPAVNSTGLVSVTGSKSCPTGSPVGANCAQYTLVVPASNPSVGVFASGGLTFSAPPGGDVLFSVDAQAAVPMSGGKPDCAPPEIMTSSDASAPPQPLKVTAGTTTDVARTDFSGCS